MRTTLFVLSLLWFVTGLGLLLIGTTLEPLALLQLVQQPSPPVSGPEAHPLFGNYGTFLLLLAGTAWALVFCVPALILAALGVLLGRLDNLRQLGAVDMPAGEGAAPTRKRPFAEKVEPHIGRV